MAVVIRDSYGVVIDHAIFKMFVSGTDKICSKMNACYQMKKELFEVYTPFYTDSQAQRMIRESQKNMNSGDVEIPHTMIKETSSQRKRRKKKPPALTEEEQKVAELIEKVLSQLLRRAKEHNLFLEASEDFLDSRDNNKSSRLSALNFGCGDMFQELCTLSEDNPEVIESRVVVLDKKTLAKNLHPLCYINELVENPEDVGVSLTVKNHQFLVPAASKFLMSTFSLLVSKLYGSLIVPGGYDLIVLDPPWNNKSVKRKKSYHTFDESELCALPVHSLSKPDCLICIWVTNNDRIISYIKDVVFPTWNVKWIADWLWMKVTLCGESVCDVRSSHKKPYERLIIGRVASNNNQVVGSSDDGHVQVPFSVPAKPGHQDRQELLENYEDGKKLENLGFEGKNSDEIEPSDIGQSSIPRDFVLVSVPCSLHSKKPPLSEVMAPYLPTNPKCLEMFARNLLPGWTSWGNEVLRHQHMDYFDSVS